MARPNFLNENRGRTFPFLSDFQEELLVSESIGPPMFVQSIALLPNSAVVDFGATVGALAFYEDDNHVTYLYEVRRTATTFDFEFRSTAPALANRSLIFSRLIASDDYETEFTGEETEVSLSLSQDACVPDSIWSGYMVSGQMQDLAAILTLEGMALRGDENGAVVEPALVRNTYGQFVRSIGLANGDRTRSENQDVCKQLVWPFPLDSIYLNHRCMTGDIRIKEGYNTSIDQDTAENKITINAVVGGGEGQPCEGVHYFSGDNPPGGRTTLNGALACDETIRSINGASGPTLDIQAGRGVTVTPDPANNRIIVDMDMSGMKLCYASSITSEVSVPSGGEFCGPLPP